MAPHFTIAQASALIAARKLSPVELTQICLERTAKLDPKINAFILHTPERALAEARAAEARVMAGRARGPLDGIPIAHKDIYCTKGLPTTAHSKLLQDHVPETDARTVTMLDDAGTVMLGKLSTHEFAMGGPSFDLPWPPARNPWNPEHGPSGSSSGTGAGVAAGLFLGGTGSDTGGSIRGPAAFCGVAGIKPTYGLCSRMGILPLSFTLDHAGPLAWTAEDCAMLLQAMAGHDPADPASANRPVPDFRSDLHKGAKGLRIGVIRNFHETDNPANPAVCAAIDDHLSAAGYAQFSRPPFIRRRGHGLGSGSTAPGDVSVDNDALLEPGMLFMVHPNQFLPETGYMMCGEPVVVTQDGFEILTQETAALETAGGIAS